VLDALRRNRFVRFLLAGGVAALANIVSRYFLSAIMSYGWAIIVAYLCGMTTAWVLSRQFVFHARRRGSIGEFGRFALVNVVAAAQVWLISVGLADYVFPALSFGFHPEELAHVVGVVAPVITSYLGHKHVTFPERDAA
jgi:putative flippase GtrA